MSKRAIIYARVSGDDRAKEGRNLSGQLDMCREYAYKKGYLVVEEIAEDEQGVSGALFDLEGLNRVLMMAGAGEFDILVVRELDRFSRKLAKQLIVEEELRRSGVSIEYVLGEYPDTPEGRLMKNVRATIAEYEREKISERTSRARVLKVKSGSVIIPKGQAPFGYKVKNEGGKSILEIVESEADIIRMIYALYTNGDESGKRLSIGSIAQRMSELGVPTFADIRPHRMNKKRGKGKWGRSSVANILKNETYAGVWHYGKRPHRDNKNNKEGRVTQTKNNCLTVDVPAIVARDVWDAAQERIKYNLEHSPRNTKYKYLLRRRVTCGNCGLKMGARSHRSRGVGGIVSYYACPTGNPSLVVRDCDAPMFRADYVDKLVWEWVKLLLLEPSILAEALASYRDRQDYDNRPIMERLQIIDNLLEDDKLQLERLIDLYLCGNLPKDMLVERQIRLEKNISALENEKVSLLEILGRNSLSNDEILTIQELAEATARGFSYVEGTNDFEARHSIIDTLDVTATLIVEQGKKVAYLKCILAETSLPVTDNPTRPIVSYVGLPILSG